VLKLLLTTPKDLILMLVHKIN